MNTEMTNLLMNTREKSTYQHDNDEFTYEHKRRIFLKTGKEIIKIYERYIEA